MGDMDLAYKKLGEIGVLQNETPDYVLVQKNDSPRRQAVGDFGVRLTPWQDANDDASVTTPIVVDDTQWYELTNDGEGAFSNTDFAQGLTIFNPATQRLDFSGFQVGDRFLVRIAFRPVPSVNNTGISLRLNFDTQFFTLSKALARLDLGAGDIYTDGILEDIEFYIGSEGVRDDGCTVEIQATASTQIFDIGLWVTKL